jgi:transmembrane 9 superfamily member 2/4
MQQKLSRSRSIITMKVSLVILIIQYTLLNRTVLGFYLPGVAPQDFERDDLVFIKVNSLTSLKEHGLPKDYYKEFIGSDGSDDDDAGSFKQCRPDKIESAAENLGEILRGDRIYNSKYQIQMRQDERCKLLCKTEKINSKKKFEQLKQLITDEYRINMILDNLPVAIAKEMVNENTGENYKTYDRGFPLGYMTDDDIFVNNHVRFTILFHKDIETDLARVVGFEVEPMSIKHEYKGREFNEVYPQLETCSKKQAIDGLSSIVSPFDFAAGDSENAVQPQPLQIGEEIIFTYDVMFKMSDIRWATRWDTYLHMQNTQIHWFSIVNSVMILLLLSGIVAVILVRALRRDISKYNQFDQLLLDDDSKADAEETGWKLVHGDVFRPPKMAGTLAVYCGSGAQLFCMSFIVMVFAVLGFLSPANRGGLMTAVLLLFVLMGIVGGYVAGRIAKTFQILNWKSVTIRTSLMFPGVAAVVFFSLNLLVWGQRSSGAAPFGTLLALLILWFGVSVPLVFVGSYFGFRKEAPEAPVRTNKIPRQIPPQKWFLRNTFVILAGGVLPFGAVFIELFFILTSLWLNQAYYIFGVLFIVFAILILTCAEIAIVLCYFQLCAEDHRWQWRSFFTCASSSLYVFIYSVFYFYSNLQIENAIPTIMYFAYMALVSYAFAILTGSVGFFACFVFVRLIYGAVKID